MEFWFAELELLEWESGEGDPDYVIEYQLAQ